MFPHKPSICCKCSLLSQGFSWKQPHPHFVWGENKNPVCIRQVYALKAVGRGVCPFYHKLWLNIKRRWLWQFQVKWMRINKAWNGAASWSSQKDILRGRESAFLVFAAASWCLPPHAIWLYCLVRMNLHKGHFPFLDGATYMMEYTLFPFFLSFSVNPKVISFSTQHSSHSVIAGF